MVRVRLCAAGRSAGILLAVSLSSIGCSSDASRFAATDSPEVDRETAFEIESDFGAEADWLEPHLRASMQVMVRLFDSPKRPPPARVEVVLARVPDLAGVAAWASPDAIGFRSNEWPREPLRLWITTHELVNLLAVHYGGAGGYPADWWSNGRSPFPVYATGLVLDELGYHAEFAWLRGQYRAEPDHELYWAIHERHGFAPFAGALRMLRDDDIDLGMIEPVYPAPNRIRSAYMIAYLSLAAGENLADLVASHGIGAAPDDWQSIHPDIEFVPYSVSAKEVEEIMAARGRLFAQPAPESDRDAFRRGEWRAR